MITCDIQISWFLAQTYKLSDSVRVRSITLTEWIGIAGKKRDYSPIFRLQTPFLGTKLKTISGTCHTDIVLVNGYY